MKMLFRALPMLALLIGPAALAQSSPRATTALSLGYGQSTERRDLGSWDDVFVREDQDLVLLRRESDLFALSIPNSPQPKKLVTTPALAETWIVAYVQSGQRLWVFCNSHQRGPFALDAHSGKVAEFEIPGLKISDNRHPGIQWHLISGGDAAILMISGSGSQGQRERTTWPRDGNRPLYFWMSLTSGEVVAFPVGWDLNYFTADQQIAVFNKVQEGQLEQKAVSVRTGGSLADIPNRRQVPVVEFDWGDTRRVKPLYARRDKTGDADYIAGISLNGLVFPFDLGLEADTS